MYSTFHTTYGTIMVRKIPVQPTAIAVVSRRPVGLLFERLCWTPKVVPAARALLITSTTMAVFVASSTMKAPTALTICQTERERAQRQPDEPSARTEPYPRQNANVGRSFGSQQPSTGRRCDRSLRPDLMDWTSWKIRFKSYGALIGFPEAKLRDLLLRPFETKPFQTLVFMCHPTELANLNVDALWKRLDQAYTRSTFKVTE
ncbi:hypothetical protein BV898_02806 [Hypsibius exemplaris]|uniref:Uncharacterized protein n=1 Tax=Hypsibius exemplaris TaxID=2072580 RepID=A0A1W0X7K4_HYPEX|nr:hypothetical protein BV898_02806 [Hypsibius exemplaris]